jgi:hypothetical protein
MNKEKKVTLVLSTIKLLYQQTKKAQSKRSNRVPEGEKTSQRDWSEYQPQTSKSRAGSRG